MATKNVNFKDSSSNDTLYPYIPTQNVIDGNGNTAQELFDNLSAAVSKFTRSISTQTTSGAVTVDASSAVLHIITMSGNVSGVTVSNAIIGQEIHVIFCSSSDATVTIANNTTYLCPDAADVVLAVPAGGFCEVNFLYNGSKFFVRGC